MKKILTLALLSFVMVSQLVQPFSKPSAFDHDEELWKVIHPLRTTTSFINTGAHPDDERSHLLTYMSLGEGARTGSLIANRGEGGQNQIGHELGNGLGIIRSEELIEASDIANVDLIMLSKDLSDPIYDFGFSKTVEETLNEWTEEITYERLIRELRLYRPEILFTSFLDVNTEHGHHRTMTVLTVRAFEDAADPTVFPEHLEEGLEPWQAKKLYLPASNNNNATLSIEVGNEIDPVYGKTYAQLGEDSRYLHKSQGMGRDLPVEPRYVHLDLIASVNPIPEKEDSIFDGLDFNFTDTAQQLAGRDNQVRGALLNVQRALDHVIDQYPSRAQALIAAHAAIDEVAKAKDKVAKSKLNEQLKSDLLFKLDVKVDQLTKVSRVASSLDVVVDVANPTLTRDGSSSVTVYLENNGDNTLSNLDVALNVPDGWVVDGSVTSSDLQPNGQRSVSFEVHVPADEAFFHPYVDSVLTAQVSYDVGKATASYSVKPTDTVAVLPHVAVDFNPSQISINLLDIPDQIDVEMVLTNYLPGSATANPSLEIPEGWSATASVDEIHFENQGDTEVVTFTVTPGDTIPEAFEVVGQVEVDGLTFATTVQNIDYEHIKKSYYLYESSASGVAFELEIPEGLKVGYFESGFDQIADYLINIGMDLTKLTEDDIISGDLSQYDSIVLGIRAYRNNVLPQNNDRLLEYVEQGGHLVVQYHTPNDGFNGQTHAPYPMRIGTPSIRWRVTDKHAEVTYIEVDSEVTVHETDHPLFNFPNTIGPADWDNWVQERALYFPMEWDDSYQTFISMADPGEDPFVSGILMAEYGEGTYMLTNLVWYRQVQGQVPGGYRLFTNLLSYPLHHVEE
ncbi:LmbE family N-acetylglucosaminyl deacetylase [Evansella vedderi]|uniref:LmbE family N-acetylglucosaminyl deacetylase n=1 Tax=Evansella vedderi TaxID=38282 RepID=A0ABT9ZQ15_9BACI|nr:PIG-L family deacetylase [Evansella vedderi]MDQ0253333.1 LmbE family N-acetylglucosaminyl deacetylase [Evansella vedderi]